MHAKPIGSLYHVNVIYGLPCLAAAARKEQRRPPVADARQDRVRSGVRPDHVLLTLHSKALDAVPRRRSCAICLDVEAGGLF